MKSNICIPASTFERVGDLADRNRSSIRITHRNFGQILNRVLTHALEIDVVHGGLRLLHVRYLFCHEILRFIHQLRHFRNYSYRTLIICDWHPVAFYSKIPEYASFSKMVVTRIRRRLTRCCHVMGTCPGDFHFFADLGWISATSYDQNMGYG